MTDRECKVIPFKTKEQRLAEIRFRHLSDHLERNPCQGCNDIESDFCLKECLTGIRKAIINNVIKNGKSF
jgi:hypothetical protein